MSEIVNDLIRFSLVVIHRNGEQRLMEFLNSAYAVIDPAQDEIIVVDNNSTDDSLATANSEYPTIKIVRNAYNTGYATACNQGIQLSQGQFVLLCNNDILLPNNVLEQLTHDFANYPKAGLIGGQLLAPDGHLSRSAGNITNFWSELGFKSKRKLVFDSQTPTAVEALYGAFMALRKSILTETGGLDEDFFFYYEETEWCLRIGQKGWQILFDPQISIVHTGGASTKGFSKAAAIELFRSRLLYWQKTMSKTQVAILYGWHIPKLIVDCGFYLLMSIATAGFKQKLKDKLSNKITLLHWLISGKPESWGLPDRQVKP